MKVRNDFVTNSSSSNYIIAFKEEKTALDDRTEKLSRLVRTLLDTYDNFETECANEFKSIDAIKGYLIEESYGCTLDDLLYDGVNEGDVQRYLDNGYTIAIKEVGYHDELTNCLIETLDSENIGLTVLGNYQ